MSTRVAAVLPVALPVACADRSRALGQRQRAAEQHDVSVAGESAEVAEEPEGENVPDSFHNQNHSNT